MLIISFKLWFNFLLINTWAGGNFCHNILITSHEQDMFVMFDKMMERLQDFLMFYISCLGIYTFYGKFLLVSLISLQDQHKMIILIYVLLLLLVKTIFFDWARTLSCQNIFKRNSLKIRYIYFLYNMTNKAPKVFRACFLIYKHVHAKKKAKLFKRRKSERIFFRILN